VPRIGPARIAHQRKVRKRAGNKMVLRFIP
jgi:hypothetical protein